MGRKVLRTGLAISALTAANAIGWAATPQAHAEPACLVSSNDFDDNGFTDLAVGSPGADDRAGSVEVHMMRDGEPTQVRVRPPDPRPGDRFGASVAEVGYYEGGLDMSTCTQLVVGAPGRDVDGVANAGAVFLYSWDSSEHTFTLVKELVQGKAGVPGEAKAGARFGRSLASPYHDAGVGRVVTPLYVGAPGYSVDGEAGAGAVAAFRLTGGDDPHVDEGTLLTQGADGMPGTAEAGDAFGRTVAATDNGVLAGTPGENNDSGGFIRWRENDSGDALFVTQNTAGVPGRPESGDRFGAAIYAALETRSLDGAYYALVGAPGEAIGSVDRAGSAIRFVYHGDLELAKTTGFNQDKAGIAGHPEAGDRFGSSFGSFGPGPGHLIVGAPGEAIGSVEDAGVVQALARNQAWHQDTAGVAGGVERDDAFGRTIGNALVPMFGEREDGWLSRVVVGVPGENSDSGMMQVGLPGGSGNAYGYFSADPGDRFGSALGNTN